MKGEDGEASGTAEGQEEEDSGGRAASIGQHPPKQAKRKECPLPWCGSQGQQRVIWIKEQQRFNRHWEEGPDEEFDCSTCGWKVGQGMG